MRPKATEIGWFEEEKDILLPATEEKNIFISQIRTATGAIKETLLIKLKNLKLTVKDKISIAKANWQRKQADIIHQMCKFPSQAWEASFWLAKGEYSHYRKSVTLRMRMENGELATNPKQNMEVVKKHLSAVYNNSKDRYADAAKFIKQREEFSELDGEITWKEFNKAIGKLKNGKAAGITSVPPDVFKCLDGTNRRQIYKSNVDF